MNNDNLSLDIQFALSIAELSKEPNEKMIETKIGALLKLRGIVNGYRKHGFLEELVFNIFIKKADFITNAKSKKDVEEILSPAKIYYNGNEVVPTGEYHVPEEELILWSMTSLRAPLVEYGLKRYMQLFKETFPEQVKILEL